MRFDNRSNETTIPICRHEGGFAAQGPGFYIWDEDAKAVMRAARELLRGNFKVNPTTRFMVMRDDFQPSSHHG